MSSKFGEFIKAGLRERGWTQAKLARQMGRPRSYIHYLVGEKNAFARRGRMFASPDEVKRIAVALGVSINDALAAADWPPQQITEQDTIHTASALRVRPVQNKEGNADDRLLYAIAHAAALDAIKHAEGGDDSRTITVHVGKDIRLTLSGLPKGTTDQQISRYKTALRKVHGS